MINTLIQSLILGLLLCIVLRNVLHINIDKSNIITVIVVISYVIWKKTRSVEAMDSIPESITDMAQVADCDPGYHMPNAYTLDHINEDTGNTGLVFNNNIPGYYLLNDNHFSSDGISYDKALSIIQNSKYNDLLEQHNYNITWSPHTHIGKNRGYINYDKVY